MRSWNKAKLGYNVLVAEHFDVTAVTQVVEAVIVAVEAVGGEDAVMTVEVIIGRADLCDFFFDTKFDVFGSS